jgi:hypothetical protein
MSDLGDSDSWATYPRHGPSTQPPLFVVAQEMAALETDHQAPGDAPRTDGGLFKEIAAAFWTAFEPHDERSFSLSRIGAP